MTLSVAVVAIGLALLLAPATASAGDWLTPAWIGDPGWRSGTTVGDVATDGRGNALAVINDRPTTGTRGVTAISLPDGQAAGAPERLASSGSQADVAMDTDGNAVAVWAQSGATTRALKAAFRPAGGAWRPAQELGAGVSSNHPVRVAMSANGLAVVTWVRVEEGAPSGSRGVVHAAVKPAGSSAFGAATELSGPSGGSPDVAVDPQGNAVVVWLEAGIQAAARPAGGSFSQLADILAPGHSPLRPHVAMDAHGRATVVWEIEDADSYSVHSAERGASGDFGAPQQVADEPTHSASPRPQVVVDPDGTALVVWIADETDDGVEDYIYRWAARAEGGTFGAPRDLDAAALTPTFSSDSAPFALAMAPDGTAMVIYSRTRSQMWFSVRRPNDAFGAPREFGSGHHALLAFDGEGDAVAVWEYGLDDVRAARYDHTIPTPPPDPNLIYNDDFETDVVEWNTSGSAAGVSLTRERGGHSGDWAAKLANTGTSAGTCALNDGPHIPLTTVSGTYAAKLWVRAETAGQTIKLRLREYTGETLAGSQTAQFALTTSWQQIALDYTPTAPGRSRLDLDAYVSAAAPGTCFLADDASLVLEPPPPPPPPPPPDPGLVGNGGFESDLAGWNTSGSAAGVSLSRVAGGHSSDWAAKLTNSGTAAATCTLNDSPNTVAITEEGTYTATLWVRADSPGQTLKLRLREYSGGTLAGSATTPVALTTSWQPVTVSYTSTSPGASTLDFNAYVTGAAPGTCFFADDAAIELDQAPPPPPDPNLFANPGFEIDLAGWNKSGSADGVTLSRESGGHSGGWAAKLANTGTSGASCTLNDAPNAVKTTTGGSYTARLWVRADSPGQTLKLRLREYSGATFAGSATSQVELTSGWQQVTVSYTPASPGSSTLDLNAYVSGAAPGTCFYADDATIQLG
jgi:Carbohydrate binding domain